MEVNVNADRRSDGTIRGERRWERANRVDVPRRQHREHALIEAQVAYRVADLALVDPPHAVARQSREDERARVDQADVPEARDQEAAIESLDHVFGRHRRLGALEDVVDRPGRRLRACAPAPSSASTQVLDRARLDERHPRRRNPFGGARRRGQVGVHRVAVQVQPFVEQLLAEARLAVLGREGAAPLVSRARVERVGQEPEQVGHRLRLEDHRIGRRLDGFGVLRTDRLADRLRRYARRVEFRQIEVIPGVVARAGPVSARAVMLRPASLVRK